MVNKIIDFKLFNTCPASSVADMRIKNQILGQINKYHVIYIALFLYFIWPSKFATIYYENLKENDIFEQLLKKTIRNSSLDQINCVSKLILHCVIKLTEFNVLNRITRNCSKRINFFIRNRSQRTC